MKGIWFNDWGGPDNQPRPPMVGPLYNPAQAEPSLRALAATGANWISVMVCGYQETLSSTNITRNKYRTAPDDSLRHLIDLAHSLGIRVALAPGVFCNDPSQPWVEIGSAFTSEKQWQEWFASYREHVNRYASFAQNAGVDLFYIGSELPSTTHREYDWRQVIKEVRERYKGLLSYDSISGNYPTPEYKRIKFWDALDYIATDFWYPLTAKNNPTVEELKQGWTNTGFLTSLEIVSKQFNKPAFISEIGYRNFDGVNTDPAGNRIQGAPEDLQEQADCYQASLETVIGSSWLKGIFWWQWGVVSLSATPWPVDPHGRPAENVLKKYYLADGSQTSPSPTTSVPPTLTAKPSTPTPTKPLPSLDAFMKGIHFNDWAPFDTKDQWRGLFLSPKTDESLNNLTSTGANWISMTVIFGQENLSSTVMFRDSPATPTDAELLRVINIAHGLGLRVMLLPSLALSNDPNHWWGQIGSAFSDETQWKSWFKSYSEIVNHYAVFAQDAKVDMLCIGRELGGVTNRENEWRQVIKEIRGLYDGPLTYSSLSSGEYAAIKWWDAVDFIGTNGYFLLTNSDNPTVAELKSAWINKGYVTSLENLSKRYNKPLVITEIGYIDQDGANKAPGDFWINKPTDMQEQADCYQAAFEVLWGNPWLKGIFWWQWSAKSNPWPENPCGKPAEEILKKYYLADDRFK